MIPDRRRTPNKVLLGYTTPEEEETLLRRLREARIEAGLEQKQVAAKAGAHPTHISRIERGEQMVHDRWLRFFSKVYGKPVGWFFGEGD